MYQKKEQGKISIYITLGGVGEEMEHLENLIFSASNPLKSAEYFSLFFKTTPTYDEFRYGTPDLDPFVRPISDMSMSAPNRPSARLEGLGWNPILDSLSLFYKKLQALC